MPIEVLQWARDNHGKKGTEAESRHGIQVEGLGFDTATILNSMSLKKCRAWVLNAVIIIERFDGGKQMVTASIVS